MIKNLKTEDFVIVDESSTRIGMVPIYARSPRGCRAYDRTIRNYGQNITLLAGLNTHGIQAAMTLEGAVDRTSFEVFISKILLPTLRKGLIVILDNLSSHKTERVQELLRGLGCQLLFLPTYSPDLSPIEKAFPKLEAFIQRYRCKTVPTFMKAIEQGFKVITAADAQGWFVHAGFSV